MAELKKLKLEDLPDEMILKVLSYVNIGDLMRCGKVSKRFGKIRDTESLWRNVDLSRYGSGAYGILNPAYDGQFRAVKANFIKFLLNKGCERLNLQGATIANGSLKLDGPSKLRRLNLDHCFRNISAMQEILNSCHILQKLSLMSHSLQGRPVFEFVKQLILRNSETLETIYLRGEYNVENLKLSRRCHKSCKTQPEGKKLSFIFQ